MTSPISNGHPPTPPQMAGRSSSFRPPLLYTSHHTVQQIMESALPFNYDRNTSAMTYLGPVMQAVEIDQATGTVTGKFSSDADAQAFYYRVACDLAAQGLYAVAKSVFDFCKSSDGMHALKSLKEGLAFAQRTSQQEEKPLDERLGDLQLADAQLTSDTLDAEEQLKKQTQAYQQAVAGMSTAFFGDSPSIDLFFKHFWTAHRLNPASFRHFFIPLTVLHCFPEGIAHEWLQKAYEVSPFMTFNTLFALSCCDISLKKERSFPFLIKAFPDDLSWHSIVVQYRDSLNQTLVQKAKKNIVRSHQTFAQQLAKGLNNILTKDFFAAYRAFSRANCYNISDKRPPLYLALLALLLNRDTVSAEKQIEALSSFVDWQKETTIEQVQDFILSKVYNKKGPEWPTATPSELPLLKSLLKFFKTDADFEKAEKAFLEAFDAYVRQREFDPLFADFLIQVLVEKVPEIHSHYQKEGELYLKLMSRLYGGLSANNVDLTEYEEFIKEEENDRLSFVATTIIAENRHEGLTLVIDPYSMKIPRDLTLQLYKKLLWTAYCRFSDLLLRNMRAKPVLDLFATVTKVTTPFRGGFLTQLLTKCDQKGDPETKIRLVKWATTHAAYWPHPQRQILADLLIRWDLSLLPGHPARETFLAEKIRWQDTVVQVTPAFPLGLAEQAWHAILNQNFQIANHAVTLLFEGWEGKLMPGFDPIGLQVLCTTRALLQNDALLGKALLKRAVPLDHEQLLQAAFSLLARQEVIDPFVIPEKELDAEEIKTLASLYLGQRLHEDEEAYKNRLTSKRLLTSFDPRGVESYNPFDEDDESTTWVWASVHENKNNFLYLVHRIEKELQRNSLRVQHNNEIAVDVPPYSQDSAFINWVRGRENLINEYRANKSSVMKTFDKQFPHFPRKNDFIEELEEKARHQIAFAELEKKTETPCSKLGERFWQLVHLTAQLVERVQTGTRSETDYDIIVQNEEEGRMVMELLYEVARLQWEGSIEELEKAFHGPEIHIFGKGPRIPHFNGSVLTQSGTLSNVHIFYS